MFSNGLTQQWGRYTRTTTGNDWDVYLNTSFESYYSLCNSHLAVNTTVSYWVYPVVIMQTKTLTYFHVHYSQAYNAQGTTTNTFYWIAVGK